MVFGSMVAGGTSMGGGAVAFPVLTKVLHIPPHEAKVFSLAIQSIGMTSASLIIMALRIRIEWKVILWVSLGGVLGILFGTLILFPLLKSSILKIIFSSMIGMFGIVLFGQHRKPVDKNLNMPVIGSREKVILLTTGLLGGMISGLVGNGIDIVSFTVMVLLFGLCEKFATPNAVILMAINAVIGFLIHLFIIQDFYAPVSQYWSAAVPVVAIGAPLGAIICKLISSKKLVLVLLVLIATEVFFTFVLVEFDALNTLIFLLSSITFLMVFTWLRGQSQYKKKDLVTESA